MKHLRNIVPLKEGPVASAVWSSVKKNAKYLPVAIPAPGGMPVWYAKVAKDAYDHYKKNKEKKTKTLHEDQVMKSFREFLDEGNLPFWGTTEGAEFHKKNTPGQNDNPSKEDIVRAKRDTIKRLAAAKSDGEDGEDGEKEFYKKKLKALSEGHGMIRSERAYRDYQLSREKNARSTALQKEKDARSNALNADKKAKLKALIRNRINEGKAQEYFYTAAAIGIPAAVGAAVGGLPFAAIGAAAGALDRYFDKEGRALDRKAKNWTDYPKNKKKISQKIIKGMSRSSKQRYAFAEDYQGGLYTSQGVVSRPFGPGDDAGYLNMPYPQKKSRVPSEIHMKQKPDKYLPVRNPKSNFSREFDKIKARAAMDVAGYKKDVEDLKSFNAKHNIGGGEGMGSDRFAFAKNFAAQQSFTPSPPLPQKNIARTPPPNPEMNPLSANPATRSGREFTKIKSRAALDVADIKQKTADLNAKYSKMGIKSNLPTPKLIAPAVPSRPMTSSSPPASKGGMPLPIQNPRRSGIPLPVQKPTSAPKPLRTIAPTKSLSTRPNVNIPLPLPHPSRPHPSLDVRKAPYKNPNVKTWDWNKIIKTFGKHTTDG